MSQARVSIVTGAAGGIGIGIAEALSRRGDRLVLADLAFSGSSVQSRVGGDALLSEADITDVGQVERLIGEATNHFGRVDCLINAVGVNRPAPIYEASEADWDLTMAVNLKGAFLLSRAVSEVMMEQQWGRIVHIGSTASRFAAPCLSAYAASKHGLVGLVRAMACDLAPYGITVNAVCPGNTDTEMLRGSLQQRARHLGRTYEDVREEIIRKTPARRLGRPDDVAAAVLFLTSQEAEYTTGQALTVDGGRSINLI